MHFFLTKKTVLPELCFFLYRFIGLVQYLEEWRPASSMNSFSIPEDIFDRPRNPLMEVSLLFYIQRTAYKNTPLDEKFSGQACEWLHYRRQFVYNSNYIVRTNICRLLEFLLLPVTKKIKFWKGSTGRVIRSLSQMHIVTVVQACTTLFVVQATSAKFGLHAGSMKFNTQSEE